MGIKRLLSAFLLTLGSVCGAQAQSDPRTLPQLSVADITYTGSFTAPSTDGLGFNPDHSLDWATPGMGMGPDGASLYIGCHDQGTAYARISIPAIGGRATIIEPCKTISLSSINPTDPNAKRIGGLLSWNGRTIMSAYSFYDGNKTAVASHFADGAGPFRVGTLNPGFVGGYMGVIPQEWRGLLGGPAFTGLCCTSIITRSSYGPSISVFDPDHVGTTSPISSTMLVGYPEAHQTIGSFTSVGNTTGFGGATTIAGVAFPAKTSTVLFVGSQPTTYCYGTGTPNQALHGQPDGQGNIYCYNPGGTYKGTHGYPWFESVWGYNAGDLADVKAGAKNPWDVKPTFIARLPSGLNLKCLRGATYDPVNANIYARGCGISPTIFVWHVNVPTGSPQPTDCVVGTEQLVDESTDNQCVNGTKTFVQNWTRTGDVPATNGGNACPAVVTPRTRTESCVVIPPPAPVAITCIVTGQGTSYADGDQRPVVRCDNNRTDPRVPTGTTFVLTVPKP